MLNRLQAEAKEKADAIRQHAQEQAESERKEILDRAKQEAERIRSQVIATAQMKARTLQLEHREKLLDKVFQRPQKKNYPTCRSGLIMTKLRLNWFGKRLIN